MSLDREMLAAVLEPHFDAVRDTFSSWSPVPGMKLSKLRRTHFVIDDSIRDKERHYAACRDDGALIICAPAFVLELPVEQMVAMLCHEFGHAADFAYPGQWVVMHPGTAEQHALWLGNSKSKSAKSWREFHWHRRSADEVEWTADSISELVTGRKMKYCGRCVLQCFGSLPDRPVVHDTRPEGLR